MLFVEGRSYTSVVPISVPSVFQSAYSKSPLAMKNKIPFTLVKLEYVELPIGFRSLSKIVPEEVPSLFHNSVPNTPSFAQKNKDDYEKLVERSKF